MVQIKSSFVFLLSAASLVAANPFGKRTVAQIQTDIAAISTKVTALDNQINAYPLTGGSLVNALAIHTSSVALISTLVTATADVTSTGPVSLADGTNILHSVEAFSPTIQDALTGIVTKKPAFVALPLGGVPALILQDLKFLKSNTTAFSNALIANSPAANVAEATTLRDTIIAAFTTAITAYS